MNIEGDTPQGDAMVDRFIELYLSGKRLRVIAKRMDMSLVGVQVIAKRLRVDERAVENYVPLKRRSRFGLPLHKREQKIIAAHQKRGFAVKWTARLLMRKPDEILPDYAGQITINRMREVAPTCDILLAHRYLFYISRKAIISDQAYDLAKREEIEFGGSGDLLQQPASDKVTDYPPHIRSLAHYMLCKFWESNGEWNWDKLPYGDKIEHDQRMKKYEPASRS